MEKGSRMLQRLQREDWRSATGDMRRHWLRAVAAEGYWWEQLDVEVKYIHCCYESVIGAAEVAIPSTGIPT